MTSQLPVLRVFLDEGVPVSVGRCFEEHGHTVIYFKDAAVPGSPDPLVATVATTNSAVLVAVDGDMKKLAQQRGVGQNRYKRLSLIKLSCPETEAVDRLKEAMSLIEHEWSLAKDPSKRRIFIEIGKTYIRTVR